MSRFPAYAGNNSPKEVLTWTTESGKNDEWGIAIAGPMSPSAEGRLLQSDSDDDIPGRVPSPRRAPTPDPEPDFYVDRKMDRGNLRVSTLYYPGRPDYRARSTHSALGATRKSRNAETARYFSAQLPPLDDAADVAARTAALQRILAENPTDLRTWLHYIDLQEQHCDLKTALSAAEAAAARLPRSAAVLAARCRLVQAALPTHVAMDAFKELRDKEISTYGRQLIDRQIALLAARSGGGAELRRMLQDKPSVELLTVYAWYLSSAGHWERLTQLIELASTLLYPRSPIFPLVGLTLSKEDVDKLEDYEDKVIHSGLPLTALWARVERARAAAHWRPSSTTDAADEERSPRESDTAALLPTVPPPPSLLLKLLQIPIFGLYSIEDDLPPSPIQQLLPMLDAAWLESSATGSEPWSETGLQELLKTYLDPPTYLASDDYGFWTWTVHLFLSTISHSCSRSRLAIAVHALRWLRSVITVTSGKTASVVRRVARDIVRDNQEPLVAVEYSKMELRTAKIRKEPLKQATRAAIMAARSALETSRVNSNPEAIAQALYVARTAASVLDHTGCKNDAEEGRLLILRAVLSRAADCELTAQDQQEALDLILKKSSQIEQELLQENFEMEVSSTAHQYEDILLPGEAEWGVVRTLLLPRQNSELLHLHELLSLGSQRAYKYGATLARSSSFQEAAMLARFYPHDPYLQIASARTPTWRQWGSSEVTASCSITLPSATRQLARALPHLMKGVGDTQALNRAYRELSRGPSTEFTARLSLATHAVSPETAIDAASTSKWVYVAAGATGGDVWSLQALMLERQLRLRALHQELLPVRPLT